MEINNKKIASKIKILIGLFVFETILLEVGLILDFHIHEELKCLLLLIFLLFYFILIIRILRLNMLYRKNN